MKKLLLVFGIVFIGVAVAIGIAVWLSYRNVVIEFVHAESKDIGKPMPFLPVFTPQSGIGQGEPIYDSPKHDLSFSLSPANGEGLRSVAMTYLGVSYALTETAQDSLAFTNSEDSLAQSKAPGSDPSSAPACSCIRFRVL